MEFCVIKNGSYLCTIEMSTLLAISIIHSCSSWNYQKSSSGVTCTLLAFELLAIITYILQEKNLIVCNFQQTC